MTEEDIVFATQFQKDLPEDVSDLLSILETGNDDDEVPDRDEADKPEEGTVPEVPEKCVACGSGQ